jgi:hypothetical protein
MGKRLKMLISKKNIYPLIGTCIGIALFYLIDWHLLIDVTTKAVVFFLEESGHQVENIKDVIYIANQGIQITAFCTFVDWLLIAMPLVSSFSNCFWKNSLAAVILIMIWFPVNIIRICFAIDMSSKGYGWWLSHELPYYVLWYFTLLIIAVLWVKKRVRGSHQ